MNDKEVKYIHATLQELKDRRMIDDFAVGKANNKPFVIVKPN